MKKTNKFLLIAIAIITVLVAFMVTQCSKIGNLKEEIKEQKENVKILKYKEHLYHISDSVKVAEIRALQFDKDQFEKLILEKDRQIEQIRNERKKDIDYYTKLSKTDSFFITKFDTIFVGKDTCICYDDDYLSFSMCNGFTKFTTNDTIKQVISTEYKHKFLWWKWGIKGITQDVWSTNPHTNIHFEEFVKIDK